MESNGNVVNQEDVQRLASFLGFGYYRITKQGTFLYCDDRAREIFGISRDEPDLTKYSIADFYVVPAELDRRLEQLSDNRCPPLTGVVPVRIDGKYILLFDMCWSCSEEYRGQDCFAGLVTKIQSNSFSPEMYGHFPNKQVIEAEKRLKKNTADINSLVHNFLHPVLKFSGGAELMRQVGKTLHRMSRKGSISTIDNYKDPVALGKKLLKRLTELRDIIPDSDEGIPLSKPEEKAEKIGSIKQITMKDLRKKLSLMINIFDYSLGTSESDTLVDGAVRDTALWLVEELTRLDYAGHEILKHYLNKEFIDFLQDILFNYLTGGTGIMVDQTRIMKMEIEAFRRYLGFYSEKKYTFTDKDVGEIVESFLGMYTPVFAETGLEIRFKRSGSLTARISADDISRVFNNLFQNARKYSYPGKGRYVDVRVRELGNIKYVEFSIENLGAPIKEEEIREGKIFLPGYRGEYANAGARDGTGAGLADARDVVAAHGGTISVISTPTKGETNPPQYNVPYLTRVTIRLPQCGPGDNTEKNHGH